MHRRYRPRRAADPSSAAASGTPDIAVRRRCGWAVALRGVRDVHPPVLDLHRVPAPMSGQMPRCSCGSTAILCPYLRLARDVLGRPLPPRQPHDPPYVKA